VAFYFSMAYSIKSSKDIEILKEGGKILSHVLDILEKAAKPGITTIELNALAEKEIRTCGGKPSFLNYRAPGAEGRRFPATLCTSINSEVVHGVPSSYILKEGDLLKIDCGLWFKNLCTDSARTVFIGQNPDPKSKKLIEVTRESLALGIQEALVGNRMGDIGWAIENHFQKNGFSVIKELVGHGVGYHVHEDPNVPNYGSKGKGLLLKEGMVLAIEPMASEGESWIRLDGPFAFVTVDNSRAAHFEHTIAITKEGPIILTQ
jgi:methionyl aminopeptidase